MSSDVFCFYMQLSVINKSNKELFNQILKSTYGKLDIEKKCLLFWRKKLKRNP